MQNLEKEDYNLIMENTQKQNSSLYVVFKYVTIGTGIIGIGFLVVIVAYFLTH